MFEKDKKRKNIMPFKGHAQSLNCHYKSLLSRQSIIEGALEKNKIELENMESSRLIKNTTSVGQQTEVSPNKIY